MRRLWLLRYGRPLLCLLLVAGLVATTPALSFRAQINLLGLNTDPLGVLLLIATEPVVVLAVFVSLMTVTGISGVAIAWLNAGLKDSIWILPMRTLLIGLLAAPPVNDPSVQARIASYAQSRPDNPIYSATSTALILGTSFLLPFSLIAGFMLSSVQIPIGRFALLGLTTLLLSNFVSIVILKSYSKRISFRADPVSTPATVANMRTALPVALSLIFLAAIAFYLFVSHSRFLIWAAVILAMSVLLCAKRLSLSSCGTALASFGSMFGLYCVLVLSGGMTSQLFTLSGIPQDLVAYFQDQNVSGLVVVLFSLLFIFLFSSLFGALVSAFSAAPILMVLYIAMGIDVSSVWPICVLLLMHKFTSTISPFGFINNAVAVCVPKSGGYFARCRLLFPVIIGDLCALGLLLAIGQKIVPML